MLTYSRPLILCILVLVYKVHILKESKMSEEVKVSIVLASIPFI